MTAKVLELEDVIQPDRLATELTNKWCHWDSLRQLKKQDWEDIRRYIYATDTSTTANSSLPWKNKTTIPKLCQIRDNLYSNYTATLFPQRKFVQWEANESEANSVEKRNAITNYMTWVMDQPSFKSEMDKIILDYIDFGNCFATVEWRDQRVEQPDKTQTGYVGPVLRRISPMDIVMNPTSEDFESSPKIVRSIISLGELKKMLNRLSVDENNEEYENLWKYLKDLRTNVGTFEGDINERDRLYQVDGFTSFREYLNSDQVEVLTFYGDLYDKDNDTLLENHVITVVDRHKLIGKKPNPSFFGYPPIFHCGWRRKQDNLWAMGPLDNLVGMQYRIDHVENMKADIYDLVTFPVQKVKGFVEDYTWQPGEKIFTSEEGDVEIMSPDVNALNANFEIQNLERMMEEMAGAPREAMGFRTPGEKTKYEVQSMENASSRVFQNKINQFSDQLVERTLNAGLELAQRNLSNAISISVFDDDLQATSFQTLTVQDITGIGRIRPVAARHFAEQTQLVQNLGGLSASPMWATVSPHFSSIKLAKIYENIFNMQDYEVVIPYIALAEQADAQRQAQNLEQQVMMEMGTASGMGNDFDLSRMGQPQPSEDTEGDLLQMDQLQGQ